MARPTRNGPPGRGPKVIVLASSLTLVALAQAAPGCAGSASPDEPPLAMRALDLEEFSPPTGPECPTWAAGVLALAGPGRTMGAESPRLRLAVGCADDGDGLAVHAALALELVAPGTPVQIFDGMAIATCAERSDPFVRLTCTTTAVGAALDVALARWHLVRGSDDELVRTLGRAAHLDRQVLLTAVEQAGDRRLRVAAPALIELLGHHDADVVMRAIGSLGRIGDPRALPALGTLAVSPLPEVWHTALQAIADIGGSGAVRALELVAGQSVNSVVTRRTRELIDEVRARGDDHAR